MMHRSIIGSSHCQKVAARSMQVTNLIFRVFTTRNSDFLVKMYITFVRSRLEYASEIWSPFLAQDIDLIERIQKAFTKRIPGMQNLTYKERLSRLQLETLEKRRLIRDLIMVYKIIFGLINLSFDDFFTFSPIQSTRGHTLKLQINRSRLDVRKYFFSNRIVKVWNFLPSKVVYSCSLSVFKNAVKTVDFSNFLRWTC